MGTGTTTAHFTLLAEPKPRWAAFGTSVLAQLAGLLFLLALPLLLPEHLVPRMVYNVVPLLTPRTEVPLPPPPPKVRAKLQPPPPEPVEPKKLAKLFAPPDLRVPKPKPKEFKPEQAPKIDEAFRPAVMETPKSELARLRRPVETGLLSTGSAAKATVNLPLHKVQTGGFGDPDGLPGNGDPNKRANIARKGSWDLPGGPGYGNGTGGANGVRGTVASTGFGNGIAIPPRGGGGGRRGAVQQSGFTEVAAGVEAPKKKAAEPTAAVQPVEILFKPDPAYTAEARQLKIEGDVLLDVVFTADGHVQVNRVIRSLGHGLDESAIRAAQQIRFKPARRGGQPVDFPATVHIVFQMAY